MQGCRVGVRTLGLVAIVLGTMVHDTSAQTPLPPPWAAQDVGSPGQPGSASLDQGVFTIAGSGANIGGTSDQFQFVYQQISGDIDVTARLDGLTASTRAKAGLMIRGSLAPNAVNAYLRINASDALAFQRRRTTAGTTATTQAGAITTTYWLRLVRKGTRVTAYASSDGTAWTTIGADTIPLQTVAYVGFGVTSRDNSTTATATVSQATLTASGLPSPQQDQDVGAPAIAGSASFNQGTYTITAAGTDIWNTSDQFHFVYQQATGDVDVSARINSIGNTDPWAKVAVMIRESLDANSRHASTFLTVANGFWFSRRVTTGASTLSTGGRVAPAPGWVRLKRNGSLFTAYESADGQNWTVIGSDTVTMGSTVFVGIAATSHNASASTTTVVDNFSLSTPTANQPPAVTLTSPANGATFTAPATISLAASATDTDGQVARVEFYNGSTLIGSDATAPFAFTWSSVPAGTYTLTAVAVDDAGARTTSAAASVTVNAGAPPPPPPRAVVFHASADDSIVTSYRFDVFASGADPNTATPIATADLGKPAPDANGDITSDQSALFNALAAGNYLATVTAVGSGGSGRSAAVTFTR
jgi:regulation of enolase protein 1 (concanavalin A-like superfamily)